MEDIVKRPPINLTKKLELKFCSCFLYVFVTKNQQYLFVLTFYFYLYELHISLEEKLYWTNNR